LGRRGSRAGTEYHGRNYQKAQNVKQTFLHLFSPLVY
jgi:hypothetical protein